MGRKRAAPAKETGPKGAREAHCSFYPMSATALRAHTEELEGYDLSKGTVRFSPDTPLPAALLRTLVKERRAQLRARTE